VGCRGGGIAERDIFFDVCDELGLLVWQEFWMTGDNNGKFGGEYSYPDDHHAYMVNVNSTIVRLRSHASLAVWVFGNEIEPLNLTLGPQMIESVSALSPNVPFRISSMTNWTTFDWTTDFSPKDGPYGILDLFNYSFRNPGLFIYMNHSLVRAENLDLAFNPEMGSVSTPTYLSLRRFLSLENKHWEFHNFQSYITDSGFDAIEMFGPPAIRTMEWFAKQSQMVQFVQYQTLFESFLINVWSYYTGILMWKSQSPWPTLRGALYDYYLFPTGGYYGVKAALKPEQTALFMMDYSLNRRIFIYNRGLHPIIVANITITAFNLFSGYQVHRYRIPDIVVGPNRVWNGPSTSWHMTEKHVLFRLQALSNGQLISNEYLRAWDARNQTFPDMANLPIVDISLESFEFVGQHLTVCLKSLASIGVALGVEITLFNKEEALDMVESTECIRNEDEVRVAGVIVEANYFSLLPQETKLIGIDLQFANSSPRILSVTAMNSKRTFFRLNRFGGMTSIS